MDGTQWADCIGLHHSASPLREALETLVAELVVTKPGEPEFATIDQLYEGAGLQLSFKDGRLYAITFSVMDFPHALPASITEMGPIPAGFETQQQRDRNHVVHRREIAGLEILIHEDHGARFNVDVQFLGDLDTVPAKPMTTSWTRAGVAEGTPPPQLGLLFGYKTHWFAVQGAEPDDIREALGLKGTLSPCGAQAGLDTTDPFISASQNGWRIVLDRWADEAEAGFFMARKASRLLKCKVCFFWSDRVIDSYAYSLFDNGDSVREWWTEDGTVQRDRGSLDDEPEYIDEDVLLDLAGSISIARLPDAPGHRIELSKR